MKKKLRSLIDSKLLQLTLATAPVSAIGIIKPNETFAVLESLNKAGLPVGTLLVILGALLAIRLDLHNTVRESINSLSQAVTKTMKETADLFIGKFEEGDARFSKIEKDVKLIAENRQRDATALVSLAEVVDSLRSELNHVKQHLHERKK